MTRQRSLRSGTILLLALIVLAGSSLLEPRAAHSADADDDARRVVATGAGLSPEKAKFNALANAVENVVGTLVLAKTMVENEELISDKVIKYSLGEVKTARVLRIWREDDLHFAKIEAIIVPDKVRKQLAAQNIATIQVDGAASGLVADTAEQRKKSAKEILTESFRRYSPTQLFSTEVVGKPDVQASGDENYEVAVKVRLTTDIKKWEPIRREFSKLLEQVGAKALPPKTVMGKQQHGTGWFWLQNVPSKSDTYLVSLCRAFAVNRVSSDELAMSTNWQVYAMPFNYTAPVKELQDRRYHIEVKFLDESGATVWDTRQDFGYSYSKDVVGAAYCWSDDRRGTFSWSYLGPFLFYGNKMFPFQDVELKTMLPRDVWKSVKTVRAELHERKAEGTE